MRHRFLIQALLVWLVYGLACPAWGQSPLLEAVRKDDVAAVEKLLGKGVNPNVRTRSGDGNEETALMIAARNGYLDIVRTLVAHGASVNFRTENQGETALAIAESTGHFDIAAVLFGAGANQGNFPTAPQSAKSIREGIPAGLQRLYWRFSAHPGAAILTGGALEDWKFIDRRWSPLKPLDPTYRMNLTIYVYSLESALREPDQAKAYSMFQDLAADLRIKANHCRATGTGLGGLVNVIVKTQRGDTEVAAWQVYWKPKILEFAKQYRAEAFPKPSSPTSQELAPGRYLMWAQDPATGKRGNEEVVTIGEGKKAVDKTLFVPN